MASIHESRPSRSLQRALGSIVHKPQKYSPWPWGAQVTSPSGMTKPTLKARTVLEWAFEYLRLGWYVLPCYTVKADGDCSCPTRHPSRRQSDGSNGPCKAPGKHPASGNGVKD